MLGICYGAQLTAKQFGGRVEKSNKREYGRAFLHAAKSDVLLKDITPTSQVWMSHADTILELPENFELLATTENIPIAAFKKNGEGQVLYGVQFHPEVYHSIEGKKILKNFLAPVIRELKNIPAEERIRQRIEKFSRMGFWEEVEG